MRGTSVWGWVWAFTFSSSLILCGARDRPFEFSLYHPYQLHDEQTDIKGARFNVFYAVSHDLIGADVGFLGAGRILGDLTGVSWNLIGSMVEGDMTGWQVGFYTHAMGDSLGLQLGLLNRQGGELRGMQGGLINLAERPSAVRGMQFGLFNRAAGVRGLQLGVINHTDQLHGVQIGLANFNASADPFYFFPLVNASF